MFQTRTVSLSSRRIFIFEDEDVVVLSPADTILEMYPETAETTSMLAEWVQEPNLEVCGEMVFYQG